MIVAKLSIPKYRTQQYLGTLSHAMVINNSPITSPLPKRLKEARLNKGLSQKSLGISIGMDEFSASARMNHYERGRHSPDFATLKLLSIALDLPVAYFYAEDDWLAKWIVQLAAMREEERSKLDRKFNS